MGMITIFSPTEDVIRQDLLIKTMLEQMMIAAVVIVMLETVIEVAQIPLQAVVILMLKLLIIITVNNK
jgi:hypothetical protein